MRFVKETQPTRINSHKTTKALQSVLHKLRSFEHQFQDNNLGFVRKVQRAPLTVCVCVCVFVRVCVCVCARSLAQQSNDKVASIDTKHNTTKQKAQYTAVPPQRSVVYLRAAPCRFQRLTRFLLARSFQADKVNGPLYLNHIADGQNSVPGLTTCRVWRLKDPLNESSLFFAG